MDQYIRTEFRQGKLWKQLFGNRQIIKQMTNSNFAGTNIQKGSYTIEAAVYVPMIMFLILVTIRGGISFYRESKNREVYEGLITMDAVSEFYTYQMIQAMGEEREND